MINLLDSDVPARHSDARHLEQSDLCNTPNLDHMNESGSGGEYMLAAGTRSGAVLCGFPPNPALLTRLTCGPTRGASQGCSDSRPILLCSRG